MQLIYMAYGLKSAPEGGRESIQAGVHSDQPQQARELKRKDTPRLDSLDVLPGDIDLPFKTAAFSGFNTKYKISEK